jgi:phosphate transport system substrate-binding protein
VYRSENSGTTWIFTRYLSKVHDGWRREFGAQTSPKWKAGKGAEAGAGVAKEVLGKAGTIGYVEYGVAKSDNLAHVQLRNLHGRYIVAEPQSFEAAVESQNWGLISVGRNASIDAEFLDAPGGQSWPIVAFNYVVMPKVQLDAKRGRVLLQFLDWSLRDYGDDLLSDLGLVKLSRELDQVIKDFLQANILDNLGAAVWTQAGGAATK